jgi:predicted amidohydrolase
MACHVIGVPPAARFSEVPASVPDRERLWRGVEPHGDWMLDGYSVIVDPGGTVLAGPLVREEGILFATLDLDVDDRPKPHLVSLAGAGADHLLAETDHQDLAEPGPVDLETVATGAGP